MLFEMRVEKSRIRSAEAVEHVRILEMKRRPNTSAQTAEFRGR
jgi:hypothetical protein